MSAPVFITHSSRDYKRSRAVVDVLEKHGLRCWISERDIGAGDNYGDAIVDAIENAKVMVLVFSANANSSDEIKKEIALASQRKLTVVPIRIEDAAPSKAFLYELITRNWIDCFPDWHRGMETLVQRVSSIVNDTPASGQTPVVLPKPKRTVPIGWIAAGVAGAFIIGGAAAYGLWPRPAPVTIAHSDGHNPGTPATTPKRVADTSGDQAPPRVPIVPEKPAADSASTPLPSSAPAASIAKPAAVVPETPPSSAPDVSPKSVPTAPASEEASKPASTPSEPVTAPASIAKPKPVATQKPASVTPSKKTQVAALGPVVPVQTIAPPAHPQVPTIGSKPPPYNAATHGGEVFVECKDCPQMVVVPRGTAILGSPQGQPGRNSNEASPHSVTIDKPFAIGRYAVTFDEWDACVADGGCNGYKPDDNGFGRGQHPVIFVSWNDANAYVAWLKKKTGQPYRLPSESEWEYAARGCTNTQCPDTPFWFGDISPDLANYDSRYSYEGSPKAERALETVPVDQGKPNPFGLYNMLGNVQQWVEDCWNPDPSSAAADGSPLLTGDCGDRAIRGGSYSDKPGALRAAARAWDAADDRESPNIGFRVVRTLAP